MSDRVKLLESIAFISSFGLAFAALTFYNLECISYDKSFVEFEYCYIKAISRSLKNASVKAKMFQLPITKITVQLAFSYRANGWKPFLYNITFDACKFLEGKELNPFVNHAYKTVKNFSNVNHRCPYNHDLMVTNLTSTFTEHMWTKVLPMPEGQYRSTAIMTMNLIPRIEINAYVKIT